MIFVILARTEGIFTDPVYSGKSFHGMMDYIRSGKVEKGSTVIYLQLAEATALFSKNAIIGDLMCFSNAGYFTDKKAKNDMNKKITAYWYHQ